MTLPDPPSECCRPLFALLLIPAVAVPQSSQTAPRSRPLDPFAQMAAMKQQSTSNEKLKQRGPQKGSKYKQRGLQLAEMPMVLMLSVRLLMLLAPAFLLIAFAHGKRPRRRAQRFEDKQAATRVQEDAHNKQKHNNQYARADLLGALTERVFDLRVHQMIERWWHDEELQMPTGLKAHNDVREKEAAREERDEPLAAKCVAAKDASIDKWNVAADKAISELSWRQKKDLALIKFAAVFRETTNQPQMNPTPVLALRNRTKALNRG